MLRALWRKVRWAWDWLTGRLIDRRMAAEFARKFPGRCAICSFHRYGYTHGFERDECPPDHDCIEGRKNL